MIMVIMLCTHPSPRRTQIILAVQGVFKPPALKLMEVIPQRPDDPDLDPIQVFPNLHHTPDGSGDRYGSSVLDLAVLGEFTATSVQR